MFGFFLDTLEHIFKNICPHNWRIGSEVLDVKVFDLFRAKP